MTWRLLKQTLVLAVTLLILVAAGATVIITRTGGRLLSVQSGSMVPVFRKGDLVVVRRVPARELAPGDIVTFINPANTKQTITHRIIAVRGDGSIQTKGDANAKPDQAIAASMVVGRATRHVPQVGRALDVLRKPLGLAMLIYVPALFVIVDEIRRLSAYYKSQAPYRLAGFAGHEPPRDQASLPAHAATASKLVVGFVLVGLLVAVPIARAALESSARLDGNTIAAIVPTTPPPTTASKHVLIRQVALRCSEENLPGTSRRPEILLFNPTKQDVSIGGWRLYDNHGVIATIPDGVILPAKHRYIVSPLLGKFDNKGLQYSGDSLALYNVAGQPVDGLSWGSDDTQLNPALPALAEGTRLKRSPPKADTNSSADWQIRSRDCKHRQSDDDLNPEEPPDSPEHEGRCYFRRLTPEPGD